MATVTIKDGDIIAYAREDQGSATRWTDPVSGERRGWQFAGTLEHLPGAKVRAAEEIVVGNEAGKIPAFHAQALIEAGACKLLRTAEEQAALVAAAAAPPIVEDAANVDPGPAKRGKQSAGDGSSAP